MEIEQDAHLYIQLEILKKGEVLRLTQDDDVGGIDEILIDKGGAKNLIDALQKYINGE